MTVEKSNRAIKEETPTQEQAPSPDPAENDSIADDKTLVKSKTEIDTNFGVGQLAWAQVGNYPYWPCVVTMDATEKSHVKLKSKIQQKKAQNWNVVRWNKRRICYVAVYGKSSFPLVHVQYFGDSCRHGWVHESSMLPFTGITDFLKLAEDSKHEVKKRNGKIISLYAAKKPIKRKWDIAIEEATEVLPMTNEERAEVFKPREEKSKYEELLELATGGRANKRERWSDSGGPNPKRIKREEVSPECRIIFFILYF